MRVEAINAADWHRRMRRSIADVHEAVGDMSPEEQRVLAGLADYLIEMESDPKAALVRDALTSPNGDVRVWWSKAKDGSDTP